MNLRKASVKTEKASRYLMQLCKHFAHKVPVEFDETSSRVEFPYGLCLMEAADGQLNISCESESPEGCDNMRAVLDDHLVRFAWKEKLELSWGEERPISK